MSRLNLAALPPPPVPSRAARWFHEAAPSTRPLASSFWAIHALYPLWNVSVGSNVDHIGFGGGWRDTRGLPGGNREVAASRPAPAPVRNHLKVISLLCGVELRLAPVFGCGRG